MSGPGLIKVQQECHCVGNCSEDVREYASHLKDTPRSPRIMEAKKLGGCGGRFSVTLSPALGWVLVGAWLTLAGFSQDAQYRCLSSMLNSIIYSNCFKSADEESKARENWLCLSRSSASERRAVLPVRKNPSLNRVIDTAKVQRHVRSAEIRVPPMFFPHGFWHYQSLS